MDQSKTDVPNLRRISKSTANLQKLRTHLVGVITHSGLCPFGKQYFGLFDVFQWKHDSNLTTNILLLVLSLFNGRYGLPPILNVQLDNCWRENKNKYVFALLSLLVEWSVFEKVRKVVTFKIKARIQRNVLGNSVYNLSSLRSLRVNTDTTLDCVNFMTKFILVNFT